MKLLTTEWVEKAEGDLLTARREASAAIRPNFDSTCFHSQQCAEKHLKALLTEHGVPFPKTHDLPTLLDLVLDRFPGLSIHQSALDALTDAAIEVRYPGYCADSMEAGTALETAVALRASIRPLLDLAPDP
jgi:HEPN domain-containing protein